MKSRLASARAAGGLDRVDRAVQMLEDEWRRHGEVRLELFWTNHRSAFEKDPVDSLGTLAALVKADLRRRFEQGETPAVADYLERFPELHTADSRVLSLVYEEFCLNEECGNAPDVESFCGRYPEWRSSLASQLRYHRLISQAAGVSPSLPRFPRPGEDFEEFHLLSLLGKGGTSRVFLAKDRSLGGKQVALKVTLDRGQEPRVQGPLDHPHIVPVNSVCYSKEGQLCGLSMPFQPGLPLDEIIRRVRPESRPRDAMAFWKVLTEGASTTKLENQHGVGDQAVPRGDGWEGFPTHGAYHEGAAWITLILARALEYAHGRQTFHRDVKPANVLLTITHGPQLLDFNLAEAPHSSDHVQAALHGGTLPYMAPEQIEAFLNPDLWGKVGARADIYSLGLVLRELITGQMPETPEENVPPARAVRDFLDRRSLLDPTVRSFSRAIPHSLEAIVGKCLAVSPDDRYPDSGALACDLDRFLKRQPLLEAANRSRRELAANWLTRHRKPFAAAGCIIGLGCLLYIAALVGPRNAQGVRSVASLPSFVNAVDLFNQGEVGRAAELLSGLAQSHPRSCLAKLYLALALNEDPERQAKAEDVLRDALAIPESGAELADWAGLHPEVTDCLVELVQDMMGRVDKFAEIYDAEDLASDEVRDARLKMPTYKVASKALLLAEKLAPSSTTVQRLLATTEEAFGEFEEAHNRLCRLIDPKLNSSTEYQLSPNDLLNCRQLRSRAAFLWAEHDRHASARLGLDIVSRLETAIEDLETCRKVLVNNRWSEDWRRKEYHVLHDKARATLTLAEVENDLRISKAGTDLMEAGKLIERLTERRVELHMKPIEPRDLKLRLKEDSNRFGLDDERYARGRSHIDAPGNSAKTRARSG